MQAVCPTGRIVAARQVAGLSRRGFPARSAADGVAMSLRPAWTAI
ncbi:hypothetical protein [Loktanella sp. SALINAS62]|nr:hypothetical protein [Loktanella sp. SALINAS62]